ncbi:acyltransferase family protein [Paenibacillus sp. PsM32]|uniref:acyltransferase family protein n=1 Tax=Paenibacillus sp. PsM32 TaxID=3030536 RepID=UPI00263B5D5D|nr:acyltransferase family protein [Paenibacillus sp. PsM32]MDN4618482.1 acyltransferase family protein [Paenibacillus sp. PsM32]
MSKPLQQHRYMSGLDGLRAFAVMAVVLYHLNIDWAPGGLLGVGIFFVLSGYLITDILAGQWERHHRFDLVDFWIRRARRLLPAMFAMIILVVLWCLVVDHSRLPALMGDVPAALFYVSNWWFIFHKVSYFESFGPASPLGHLWSLAVEEQFYLIWPLLLALGLKFLPKRVNLAGWILSLAAISALLMAVLYEPGSDPSRVYYGTDTRIFALLIGAALAIVWPSAKLKARVSSQARTVLDVVGVVTLFVLGWMIWHTNEYQPFLYRGGMVLIAIITALLIATLAHPASRLAIVLGCKPLRWLGKRSYGLYLWHFPVITLSTSQISTTEPSIIKSIVQVAVSLALAELSWRYIEQPIRYNGFRSIRLKYRLQHMGSRVWLHGAVILVVFVLASTAISHLISNNEDTAIAQHAAQPSATVITPAPKNVSSHSATTDHTNPESSATGDSTDPSKESSTATTEDSPESKQPTTETSKTGTEEKKSNSTHKEPVKTTEVDTISGKGISAIGDSVMLDVAPYLSEAMPGIVIDGKIGRQLTEASGVVQQLSRNGQLGHKVILELGTNGSFTKEQLDDLLADLKSDSVKKIIVVNTRVPRPWESVVNQALSDAAAEDSRITIIDWYSASAGQDSYFAPDGVHLNPSGARAYAALVVKALK